MSELENLTKTLIQVVGSLQELISKRNTVQTTLEPEVPRLKKTPEMTYNEFIKKALATKNPVQNASKKSSFTLQEDLQILSELSNYNNITVKTFDEILKKKKFNRTVESLKERYHDYLYKIDEDQMKKIVSWIERQGVEGYLNWDQQVLKIQLNDPGAKKIDDKKRQRPSNTEQEGKKQQKISKKSKTVPANCKQLNQVLKLYSKMVNTPIRQLTVYLDQLSGDLVALDTFMQTKDNRLLWTPEEDQILRKGGPQIQILRKYRGASVQVRRKYLGL